MPSLFFHRHSAFYLGGSEDVDDKGSGSRLAEMLLAVGLAVRYIPPSGSPRRLTNHNGSLQARRKYKTWKSYQIIRLHVRCCL